MHNAVLDADLPPLFRALKKLQAALSLSLLFCTAGKWPRRQGRSKSLVNGENLHKDSVWLCLLGSARVSQGRSFWERSWLTEVSSHLFVVN